MLVKDRVTVPVAYIKHIAVSIKGKCSRAYDKGDVIVMPWLSYRCFRIMFLAQKCTLKHS